MIFTLLKIYFKKLKLPTLGRVQNIKNSQKWRYQGLPEGWNPTTSLHGITIQKTMT
jgi:hypothetical protein